MSDRLITRVQVARRFTRAIRVDADLDASALDGYVCSQSAVDVLLQMARHQGSTGHGAFTWTGPYGSGKSSLALALVGLAAGKRGEANALLASVSPADAVTLTAAFRRPKDSRWLVAAVVGRRDDPEAVLSAALADAVRGQKALERKSKERFAAWAHRVSQASDRGLLLIVDEMGKFLEHAARGGGDVHLFQELAEMSARSKGRLLVVGILHQAFDEYAHRLAREARDEWLKVQGRYLDIAVNLASEEQLDLVGRAIVGDKPETLPAATAVAIALRSARFGDPELLARRLTVCWPLHPVVAALLGPISRRRFGQNQRSLFGFLNSAEPFGFQAFLNDAPARDAPLYPVARLWDYLHANLEPAILASPDGHRWSTALEAVGRAEAKGATDNHLGLLKAIALLDLFKDRSGLQATPEILSSILEGISAATLLDDLKLWSVVIYRNHTGTFAIYAGSDFDIEAAVKDARRSGAGVNYRQLSRQAGLQPVLAKRHYEVTGALRWFEVELAPVHEIEDRVRGYKAAPGAAGLFLLAVSAQEEERAKARAVLTRAMTLAGDRLVVCGWSRDSYMIREMAADVAALEHVRSSRAELEGDAIARREVDARLARLSADLEDRLAEAISTVDWTLPASAPNDLVANVTGPAGLTVLASRLADWRYPKAPRLPNELVNRTRPSSNAAAATRQLLWAMVEKPEQNRLGFENYPPELGLYISVLESTGLHHRADDGAHWRFAEPATGGAARLDALWAITDEVLGTSADGLAVTTVFDLWRAPPFGLRDGLLPILLTAYLLTRAGRSAVYLDGVFRPSLDKFLVDRLLQDPASLKVKAVELTEVDVAFIASMSEVLSIGGKAVPPTPLDVAKILFGEIKDLPTWTLRTAQMGERARQLRDRVRPSDDPNRLLLEDLPAAMDTASGEISGPALAKRVNGALTELRDAYPAMLADLQATMLRELRVKTSGEVGLAHLRHRSENVRGLTGNFRLDALAARLSTFTGALEEMEGIASLAANKPPRDWVDRNVLEARIELAALAQQFLKAEAFARIDKRSDGRVALAVYISDPDYPEPHAQEIELSAADRRMADDLATDLAALLDGRGASHEIAVAALASLGLRLAAAQQDDNQRSARAG